MEATSRIIFMNAQNTTMNLADIYGIENAHKHRLQTKAALDHRCKNPKDDASERNASGFRRVTRRDQRRLLTLRSLAGAWEKMPI